MARGVNRCTLIGNAGQDPELKYSQSGTAICNFSLATSSVRKDRDGNQTEKTEWHRIKAFGKTAEIIGEYLKKGKQIYIEGRIEYGQYDKEGVTHYTTDIIAENFQFLGSNSDGAGDRQSAPARQSNGNGNGNGQRASSNGGNGQQRQPAQRQAPPPPPDFDDGLDSIPF